MYLPAFAQAPSELEDAGAAVVIRGGCFPMVRVCSNVRETPVDSDRIVMFSRGASANAIRDRDCVDPYLFRMGLALRCGFRRGLLPTESYLESLAEPLASHLQRYYTRPLRQREKSGLSEGRLAKALAFVDAHVFEAVPLAALADAANLSLFHFGRMFKRSMGVSPAAYMIRQRVEVAEELLARSSMSIAEVASRLGFQTQAHFCTAFKRVRGIPPSHHRRNSRRGEH